MALSKEELLSQERFYWIMQKAVRNGLTPLEVRKQNPKLNRNTIYNAFRTHPRYALSAQVVQATIDTLGWDWKALPPAAWERDYDYDADGELAPLIGEARKIAQMKGLILFVRAERMISDTVSELMQKEAK